MLGQRLQPSTPNCSPILHELRSWLDRQKAVIPPKTPLGKGLGYLDRQWPRLQLFLEDGNIEATNNRRERELRRLVLGRKNWLFAWLDEDGSRTGDILSIVATCIAHDVNPRAYIHRVVHCIVHGWPQAKLRDLLPDRMLAAHPELYIGDPDALPLPSPAPALTRSTVASTACGRVKLLPIMDKRELAKALEDTLALLDSVGEPFWASKIRGVLGSIDPGEILSWYGGMGSFNDLVIATINGHRLKRGQESVTNARFAELRSQVYELATRAKR